MENTEFEIEDFESIDDLEKLYEGLKFIAERNHFLARDFLFKMVKGKIIINYGGLLKIVKLKNNIAQKIIEDVAEVAIFDNFGRIVGWEEYDGDDGRS